MSDNFHERFDLLVGQDEARRRFVNRIHNTLFEPFLWHLSSDYHSYVRRIYTHVGERYAGDPHIEHLTGYDFLKTLRAAEGLYVACEPYERLNVDAALKALLGESEVDLGVRWDRGKFLPTGATLLDERLVNDPLRWLGDPRFLSIRGPFAKGLEHLLHSEAKPDLRPDVLTDMYEALEATAKTVCANDKDLSANRELFLSKVHASDAYKDILRWYIQYANLFRHAEGESRVRPQVEYREAESFVYLTGLFIRLAIPQEG
jgi:hypothetical protein